MTTVHAPTRIRVETPDARTAFVLERRLAPFHAFAVGRGPAWGVELDDYDDQFDEVAAAVCHWLRDTDQSSAVIRVDGVLTTISIT